MAKNYHGSSVLFEDFDISHALEGDGKAKYGFGAYTTDRYARAAHYAFNKKRPENRDFYVYTFEIPDRTETNTLSLLKRVPVSPSIVERTEARLGVTLPPEAKAEGIPFRKYIANWLTGVRSSVKQMTEKTTPEQEKAASTFLREIGVDLIMWPIVWSAPDEMDYAVLDPAKMRLLRIEQVDLDPKRKYEFIPGSQRLIKAF